MTEVKMSPADFGRKLIESGDLDPVYTLLWQAKLEPDRLRHWLMAYWCFYHVGTASWIIDQPEYWKAMMTAARSKEYPRSPERRHFRGENAIKSVKWLGARGIDKLLGTFVVHSKHTPMSLYAAMEWAQTWVGFGPWISFKVADMLERLDICPIKFDTGAMFLFDSPRVGAELMYTMEKYPGATVKPEDSPAICTWAVATLQEALGGLRAPPRMERTINVQEVETVLCKWKSYMGGHYEIGEDIAACRKGLMRFARSSPTCQRLYKAGREAKLWHSA